jgi:hypothetical protein
MARMPLPDCWSGMVAAPRGDDEGPLASRVEPPMPREAEEGDSAPTLDGCGVPVRGIRSMPEGEESPGG